MKNFWKIVMLTVLCVPLLCGVTAMAEADRFQFEKTNLTVFEGNTLELSLIRQGNCAADGELTFVSGRENIATVDENGVVTGLTKGQATITATLKTEKRTWKASVTVTVARAVTDIAVNETSLTLYDAADPLISHLTGGADGRVLLLRKGKQVSIRATLSPNDANNRRYTVASSDTDVVRVSGSTLTARGAGECIVTVASESNPEVSVDYRVIVITPVTGVTVTADTKTLFIGTTAQLTATVKPADASITGVKWESTNEKVAVVDEYGVVTGVGRGQATIRATAADGGGQRASVNVTVKQQPESITLSGLSGNIRVGGGVTLKATVLPNTTSDKAVVWSTSDASVATVSANGYVKGVRAGSCTITCQSKTFPEVYAQIDVTVYAPVTSITFNEKKPSVAVGRSIALSWTVKPQDATDSSVSFSTNKPDVVSVSDDGIVTGLKRGECYVYATANDGSGKKATIRVTVTQPVTGVTMKYTSQNVGLNKYTTNTAILEPANADNKKMQWTSQDERIATVSGNGLNPKVTGRAWGTTTIIGTTDDGSYVVTYTINVGSRKDALRITNLWAENNAAKIVVYNASNLTITKFYYTIYLYNAFGEPLVCNTDGRSFSFTGTYNFTLAPGEATRHGQFSFGREYIKPYGVGQVVMRINGYDIEGGEHYDIPANDQPEFTWKATIDDGQG